MEITHLSERRKDLLAFCGKTEDDIKEYLDILREWMKKLPHLPSDLLEDQFLEQHIIKSKFSIEKTKAKIENYCTMKNKPHIKQLFEGYTLIPSKESLFYAPMPNLMDDFYRVFIGKIWDEEKYDMKSDFSNMITLCEILSRYDYSLGEIYILDMTECSIKFLTKLRPNIGAVGMQFILKCYSARIKEVHIISNFGASFINWCKPLLPSKIASRFFAHDDAGVLTKLVPAKCLPKDYGGKLKSLKELLVYYDGIYAINSEKINQYVNTSAREELRQGGSTEEEMQGTFKKLNID